jgi:hypothetical protein
LVAGIELNQLMRVAKWHKQKMRQAKESVLMAQLNHGGKSWRKPIFNFQLARFKVSPLADLSRNIYTVLLLKWLWTR